MICKIDYAEWRSQAIKALRCLLEAFDLQNEQDVNSGCGLKFTCSKPKPFSVLVYFKLRTGRSTCLVCENTPDEVLDRLRSLATHGRTMHSPAPRLDRETEGQDGIKEFEDGIRSVRLTKPMVKWPERIGTDESGKGDYFGPLVVAGVYLNAELEERLSGFGVKDSKDISDEGIIKTAPVIRELLGGRNFNIVKINPARYNELHSTNKNLNKILAWAHATAIENLLERLSCQYAIVDQFANQKCLQDALGTKGQAIEIFQTPKAERDTAVAAASVLAREAFLLGLGKLGRELGYELVKGASGKVDKLARRIADSLGSQALAKVAKLHFANTKKAGVDLA
jgi:ribonuclease HIII